MQRFIANSSSELEQILSNQSTKTVVLLFTGSKKNDGKSWCPDCVVADPVIDAVLEQLKTDDSLVFVTVPVGDLPTWKNSENQYRKHPKYLVNCVPTLINLNKGQRLEEGGCAKQELVKQLFEGSLTNATTIEAGTCEGGVCRIR